MRLMAVAVAAAFVVGAVSAADAQQPPNETGRLRSAAAAGSTYVITRDEHGRTRTRILVQKRSYLDGGTEVMPGDIQTHQTTLHRQLRPTARRGLRCRTTASWPSRPVNDPFFLPGKNNPFLQARALQR